MSNCGLNFWKPARGSLLSSLASHTSAAMLLLGFLFFTSGVIAQELSAHLEGKAGRTYCNPVNIDYGYTPIPISANGEGTGQRQIR